MLLGYILIFLHSSFGFEVALKDNIELIESKNNSQQNTDVDYVDDCKKTTVV